jgi:hypothetical protein
MARPDITELGESLLSGKIERVRKQEKRAEKDQRKALLMGLGLQLGAGVVKSVFDNKVQDWATNEGVFAARAKHNTALMSAQRTIDRQKEIDKFEGSGVDYFYKTKVRPRIETIADQYFRDQGIDRPSQKQLESFYHGEGYKIAEKMYSAHEKARAAIPMLGTAEERDAYLASKDKRPDSMFEILAAKIQGRSKEDFQREYLRTIEMSPYAQSAKIINEAENVLLSTGDDFAAENYVKYKDRLARIDNNIFKEVNREEFLATPERPYSGYTVYLEASDGTKKKKFEFKSPEDEERYNTYAEDKTTETPESFIYKGVEMYRIKTKTVSPLGKTVVTEGPAQFVHDKDKEKYGSLAGFWPVTVTKKSSVVSNGVRFTVTENTITDNIGNSTQTLGVAPDKDFKLFPKEEIEDFRARMEPYFGKDKDVMENYKKLMDETIDFAGEDTGYSFVLDATAKKTRELEAAYQVNLTKLTGNAFYERAANAEKSDYWVSKDVIIDGKEHIKPVIGSGVEALIAAAEAGEDFLSVPHFKKIFTQGKIHADELSSMTQSEIESLFERLDALRESGANPEIAAFLFSENYNVKKPAQQRSFYYALRSRINK